AASARRAWCSARRARRRASRPTPGTDSSPSPSASRLASVTMRALVTLLVLLGAAPAFARVCGDSCLEAARGGYVTCRQDAGATFALAKQLCRDRDPACVQACAERQQDCNTATGSGAALEACLAQQQAALASCVDRFAAGTKKRDQCLENARIDGFQCRNRARSGTAAAEGPL